MYCSLVSIAWGPGPIASAFRNLVEMLYSFDVFGTCL